MNKKLILTKAILAMEILAFVFCLGAFIVAAAACAAHEQIPAKYDRTGNVIRYDSPGVLFLLPAVMLFTNVLFSLIVHFVRTESWNLPFTLRPGREPVVYRDTARMLIIMELLFGVTSFLGTLFSYLGSRRPINFLNGFLVLGMGADIIVSMVLAARHNKGA
ncbi:MAG: hypothetical protein NC517_04900 [Firmicutes bacterium]|nr:hypothetical protein [Bacillota bacterium]